MGALKPPATLTLPVRSLARLLDDGGSPLVRPRIHPDAAAALLDAAADHPADAGYRIEVRAPADPSMAGDVGAAVRSHFEIEAGHVARELEDVIRQGVKSLLIAMFIVAALFAAVEWLHALGERRFQRLLIESLIIISWVTLWIPVESLLFQNFSLRRRRKVLRALARAEVEVVAAG